MPVNINNWREALAAATPDAATREPSPQLSFRVISDSTLELRKYLCRALQIVCNFADQIEYSRRVRVGSLGDTSYYKISFQDHLESRGHVPSYDDMRQLMDEAQHDRRVRRCFCRKPWLATWRVRPGHGRYADTLAADLAVGHWYNDEDAESEANGGEEGVEPDDSEASVEGDSEDDDEDADGEADDDEASVEGYSDGDETSVEGDSEDDEASAEGDDDITAVLYALFLADVELGDKVARRAALLVLEAVLWLYEQDKLFATLRELKVDRALPFSDGQRWDIEKQFNLRV